MQATQQEYVIHCVSKRHPDVIDCNF